MPKLSELLAVPTDYDIEMKLGIALLFLLITAVVFLGLGMLIGGLLFGRRKRGRTIPEVSR